MSFEITILGSSGALPAHGRFPSSQYVHIQNNHFLIDCGEGTQLQLKQFQIPFHSIDHIFISHLHGDHYLGLMGLLFSMHLQRRTRPLHIYSQRGLDEIIVLQLKYSKSSLNFKLVFHATSSTGVARIYEDKVMYIETIPLKHKIPCTGFLFREKEKPRRIDKEKLPEGILIQQIVSLKSGKDVFGVDGKILYKNKDYTLPPRPSYSFAYCSDTAYEKKVADQIQGVDLLYHEATFANDQKDKATETLHSTAEQAARIAKQANVGKLVIGHFSARYKELESLLSEAISYFPNTQLAIEGESINLEKA